MRGVSSWGGAAFHESVEAVRFSACSRSSAAEKRPKRRWRHQWSESKQS